MSGDRSGPDAFLPFAPYPDRDSEPYWRALAEGALRLQRCTGCGALRWPPRGLCNRCRSFEAEWQDLDGRGRVASWVRTHQVFAPDCREAVPYVVVEVELDAQDDLRLIGGWLGDEAPRSGERVELELVAGMEGFRLPCWRPLSREA